MSRKFDLRPDELWELALPGGNQLLHVTEIFEALRLNRYDRNTCCRREGESAHHRIADVFRLVNNVYGLLRTLGEGTFGQVDEAWDAKNYRLVAIKTPTASFEYEDRRYISRLYAEEAVRTASLALTGDLIVRVLDYEPSVPYLVLELCDGGTLRDRASRPYSSEDVIAWGYRIARVLACAHALQPDYIVHRDLKPTNILFAGEILKVADFGGAMVFAPRTTSLRSLRPWGFTPAYAPPEAWRQETRCPTAFDVWSLGIVLYELLCGDRPFGSESLERQITEDAIPSPLPLKKDFHEKVSDALLELVHDCLNKDPTKRPTAVECSSCLQTLGGAGMDFLPVVDLGNWIRSASKDLYKDNSVVLREVFQNALDAIRMLDHKRKADALIRVEFTNGGRQLRVWDTGIGMTIENQIAGFWRPYGSSKRDIPDAQRHALGVVGQFGIGAYAAFRAAQAITVVSRVPGATGPAQGTRGALKKPLREYGLNETPEIMFSKLTPREISVVWKDPISHGTLVALDLVDAADIGKAKTWLKEATQFIREKVLFGDEHVNRSPSALPTVTEAKASTLKIDVAAYDASTKVDAIEVSVSCLEKHGPTVALRAIRMTNGTVVSCGGAAWLASKKNSKGLTLLKHGFPFLTIPSTKSWIGFSTFKNVRAVDLDGYLDLPLLTPNLSRDGLDENSEVFVRALLTGLSWSLAEAIGRTGGIVLKECHALFDFIWAADVEKRHEVLAQYSFKMLPDDREILFRDLIDEARRNPDLKHYFITDDADQKTRQNARALSVLNDCRVMSVPGPEHWRGYCLANSLEEAISAKNLDGLECFTGLVDEDEMGEWKGFRAYFTQALDDVIGRGRQLQLAKMYPKEITLVLPEQGGVVYANFNNPEIAALPAAQLFGPSLEARIRRWVFGKIEAEKLEEALILNGKLVVVQDVKQLIVVDKARTQYVPKPEDLFLLISHGGESRYCLRMNVLSFAEVRSFVDDNGCLKNEWRAELNWAGHTFCYILSPARPDLPSLVVQIKTGVLLASPEGKLNGNIRADFRFEVFEGAHLAGPQRFLVLPNWVGALLDKERISRNSVLVSIISQQVVPKNAPSGAQ